tara:strand:+ start:864 stop:1307 length:444 start_codon:yes stop_codon:yes gene_type:complete
MAVTPNRQRLKKLMGITEEVPRRMNVISVTDATKVLSATDSGALVLMANASGICTITLPAPDVGLHFEIYAATAQLHKIQTDSEATILQGNYRHNSATTTMTRIAVVDKKSITLHSSGRAIGDRLEFWSDGTNWYVDGIVNNTLTLA